MIFFALLVAIVLDYSFPFPYERRLQPLVNGWQERATRWTVDAPDWAVWGLRVGAPVVAASLVYWLILWVAAPFAWVWLMLVLYVCAGYGDFKDEMSPLGLFGRVMANVEASDGAFKADEAIRFAWRRVVGVWLSFLILAVAGFGPAGAVLFRLAAPTPEATEAPGFAGRAWHWISWLPARLMVVSCAMVGAFDGAMGAWRQPSDRDATERPEDNESLVLHGVLGSFGENSVITPGMIERLMTRLMRLLLAFVLLATLIL